MQFDDIDIDNSRPGEVRFTFKRLADPDKPTYEVIARLEVTFGNDSSGQRGVTGVWLKSEDKSLTGSELNRFAWTRWLKAAQTIDDMSAPSGITSGEVTARIDAFREEWTRYDEDIQAAIGHPGRGGHGDAHYKLIAKLYQRLVEEGEPHPIKSIATRYGANRNTVSGWIQRARRHGYLPEGKTGKAG